MLFIAGWLIYKVKKIELNLYMMKSYKSLEELNKDWEPFGLRVNKEGEILAIYEEKEYKVGQLKGFTSEKQLNQQLKKDIKKAKI